MGDLYRALRQGEQARAAYGKALAMQKQLVQAEPEHADHQRDLSVAYNKMGNLCRALGRASRRATPMARRSRLRSGWRRPKPIASTTSATSRRRITGWATSIWASGKGSRHAPLTARRSRLQNDWRRPNRIAPTTSATFRSPW